MDQKIQALVRTLVHGYQEPEVHSTLPNASKYIISDAFELKDMFGPFWFIFNSFLIFFETRNKQYMIQMN